MSESSRVRPLRMLAATVVGALTAGPVAFVSAVLTYSLASRWLPVPPAGELIGVLPLAFLGPIYGLVPAIGGALSHTLRKWYFWVLIPTIGAVLAVLPCGILAFAVLAEPTKTSPTDAGIILTFLVGLAAGGATSAIMARLVAVITAGQWPTSRSRAR